MLSESEFYSYLFSTTEYKDKIHTTILYGTVADLATKFAGTDDKIVVFCVENDFVYAKKAEKELKTALKNVSLRMASERDLNAEAVRALTGDASVIVAVGEEPTISACKGAAFLTGAKLVAIYTSCKMTFALSPDVALKQCGKQVSASRYTDFLIVAPEYYSSQKKQYLVETLGETAAALADIIDYKVAVFKSATTYDKNAVTNLLEAINFALSPEKFTDAHTALTLAAIKIAIAREYSDALKFSAAEKIASFLCGDALHGEKKYRAFLMVIQIYRIYLTEFSPALKTPPDAVRAAKRISDYYRLKEYDIWSEFSSLSDSFCKQSKTTLFSALNKDVSAILSKIGYIESLYSYLYNGKHKLSAFSPEEMRMALKRAAYSSENNLLALAKADGFANFI